MDKTDQGRLQIRVGPLLALGVLCAWILATRSLPEAPLWFSVSVMFGCVLLSVLYFKRRIIGAAALLSFIVFLLPFIHIPPYLWFDFKSEPLVHWGFLSNPYMFDVTIIRLTALIGATGAAAFLSGMILIKKPKIKTSELSKESSATLSLPIWSLWVLSGLFLSWISAPTQTVLETAYSLSSSKSEDLNFSSAWMFSYILLTFTFVDALLDSNEKARKFKLAIILSAVAFIVIFLQFLRGNRESIPWIISLGIVGLHWLKPEGALSKRARVSGILAIICIFIANIIVGVARSNVEGLELREAVLVVSEFLATDQASFSNLVSGTWSAALLTPLSVAGDAVNALSELKNGQDYWDILKSLPPGIVSDFFGYTRPLSAQNNPGLEMRYGLGGLHATVLPFRNFGILGIVTILSGTGVVIAHLERRAYRIQRCAGVTLLATLALAAPHWIWYSEKYGINAVVIWYVCALVYKASTTFTGRTLGTNGHLEGKE